LVESKVRRKILRIERGAIGDMESSKSLRVQGAWGAPYASVVIREGDQLTQLRKISPQLQLDAICADGCGERSEGLMQLRKNPLALASLGIFVFGKGKAKRAGRSAGIVVGKSYCKAAGTRDCEALVS